MASCQTSVSIAFHFALLTGTAFPPVQTKALFDRYDSDGSGFLSYEEVR